MCKDWVLTKPCLCSKLSLFKMPWQILEVLPQLRSLDPSLPYLRAFQWGTIWPYTSRCIKTTTGLFSATWKWGGRTSDFTTSGGQEPEIQSKCKQILPKISKSGGAVHYGSYWGNLSIKHFCGGGGARTHTSLERHSPTEKS